MMRSLELSSACAREAFPFPPPVAQTARPEVAQLAASITLRRWLAIVREMRASLSTSLPELDGTLRLLRAVVYGMRASLPAPYHDLDEKAAASTESDAWVRRRHRPW